MADNNKIIGGAYIVNDPSPGGLFNNGNGTNPQNYTASRAANLAINEAEKAQGWAIGDTDTDGDSWSETNNSKYWAEQSREAYATVDSEIARVEGLLEEANETVDRIQNDIDSIDEEIAIAQAAVASADSDALVSKYWAVGPTGTSDIPTDTDNAHYWSVVASHHAGHGDTDGALHYARRAQGWAIGDTDADPDGFNATNNAFYYSGQAEIARQSANDSADEASTQAMAASTQAGIAEGHAGDALNHAVQAESWAIDTDLTDRPEGSAKYWAQISEGHSGGGEYNAKVARSWAAGDTDIGDTDNPVFGGPDNNAFYLAGQASDFADAAAQSAEDADTDAMNAATSATNAATSANLAEQWATDTDITTFTEGSAKYWAQQAQSYVVDIVDPDNLNGHAEFEPQLDNTTTVVGIHNDGSETLFDGIDLIFRRDFDTPGSHRVYEFGRKPDGQYRESHLFVSTNVDTDNAKDGWLLSEHHHMSHAKVADGHDSIDVEDADTFDLITIYDFDSELINNQIIDENYWATRTWVTEHTGGLTTDTANIFDTDIIRFGRATGSTSTLLELNNNTNGYNPGTPVSTAVYTFYFTQNGIVTVVSEVLGSNITVSQGDGISRGHWSWPQTDEVILHGNYPAPPLTELTDSEHVFVRIREATDEDQNGYVGHVGYGLDTDGGTLTVDTDTIADSEWVIEYVATHGGGGTDSTNLTVTPAQTNVVEGSGDTDITFTVNVSNGTLVAGSTSATATDQNSHGVTPTKVNDTEFTLTVDRSIAGTATIVVTGQISDGTNNHQHTNRARVTVAAQEVDWYIGRGTSAPTVAEPAGYTNAGPKSNGETITAPSGTDTLYIIAPASDTEFAFRDEFLTINTTKTANFVTDRDLYTFDEHVDADIVLTIVGG